MGPVGTGSGDREDVSREEVLALLVEVEAAERVERPFFRGGCLVVPGEWRSCLAELGSRACRLGSWRCRLENSWVEVWAPQGLWQTWRPCWPRKSAEA